MNMKEMEALVQKHVLKIEELFAHHDRSQERFDTAKTGIEWLRSAVDGLQAKSERYDADCKELFGTMAELLGNQSALSASVEALTAAVTGLSSDVVAVQRLMGATAESEPFGPEIVALRAKLDVVCDLAEDLRIKVDGRNKSAPVKRNMTDADAEKVLKGDLAALGHKEAAESIGLTYAQVYSCRLGFTFKHVHKLLEKEGWKSPWAKG